MFDLALSENYDLVLSASRDLAGISGDALGGQRIKTRMRIEIGSWSLNTEIGSIMTSSLNTLTTQNLERIRPVVMDAVKNMDDFDVNDVELTQISATQVLVEIYYQNRATVESLPVDSGASITTFTIGIGPESGGDF